LEYDATFGGPNQLKTESYGEVKYAAPDKGLFNIAKMFVYTQDPKTSQWQRTETEPEEYWTCDGKSTFQVDHKNKQVIEAPIPPELQGKAIADGPLPFVFGAKAEALKNRYYMRITTPASVSKDQIWLEAFPKWQKDAANFAWVELILTRSNKVPYAIQIYSPGDDPLIDHNKLSRTMIRLDKPSINSPLSQMANWLSNFARPSPIGYKHVLQQSAVAPPAAPQTPAASQPLDQASRPRQQPR
jgi:TIGR03009 family protein